jgi:uncharacterized membrane protein YphA (DoxX/SURF4 family)
MFIDTVDPLVAWIAAAAIAALFAHAALTKFADLALLEQHMAAYRVPYRLLAPLTRALPAAELLAALLLLLSPLRAAGALLAAVLLLGYAAAMGWQRAHGRRLDCGCGGPPLPVSWALVARNAVLAAFAAVAALPVAERALSPAEFFVVAAAVLLGTVLYAAFNQVLRQSDAVQARRPLGRV